jgi:hypothetical protein
MSHYIHTYITLELERETTNENIVGYLCFTKLRGTQHSSSSSDLLTRIFDRTNGFSIDRHTQKLLTGKKDLEPMITIPTFWSGTIHGTPLRSCCLHPIILTTCHPICFNTRPSAHTRSSRTSVGFPRTRCSWHRTDVTLLFYRLKGNKHIRCYL